MQLLKRRDVQPRCAADSGNTYALRRKLMTQGPKDLDDAILSADAYTFWLKRCNSVLHATTPDQGKALVKTYLRDSDHWVPERRRLHGHAYSALQGAGIEWHERNTGAKPLMLLMRGNSGVGKTYFLNNLASPLLTSLGLPTSDRLAECTVNPDRVKQLLRSCLQLGEIQWSEQIHWESSMLTDRLSAAMMDGGRHFVVDRRLATVSEVASTTGPEGAAGYRTVMVDIDAPLQLSLGACRNRGDQGAAVRPPDWVIEEGFKAARKARQAVAVSPLIDAYYSFARVMDAQGMAGMVAVAARNEGESVVTPLPGREALWRQITSLDESTSYPTSTTSPTPRPLGATRSGESSEVKPSRMA